jgi:hypothetical protein
MRRQAHRGDQGGAIPEVPETSARLDHGRMTDMKTLSSVITITPDPSEPPDNPIIVSDDAARDAVKSGLLDIAEGLTVEAGYAAAFKDRVYGALIHHVRRKFLSGSSLGLAERQEINFAWKMLPQVKAKVGATPGLIAGIIEYGDQ